MGGWNVGSLLGGAVTTLLMRVATPERSPGRRRSPTGGKRSS